MRKNRFLFPFLIAAMFAGQSALVMGQENERQLSSEQRRAILTAIPGLVSEEYLRQDPVMEQCWEQAINGDDASLIAIFILAKVTPVAVTYRQKMSEIAVSDLSVYEKGDLAREFVEGLDYKEVNFFLGKAPAAITHCLESAGGMDLSEEKRYLSERLRKELDIK